MTPCSLLPCATCPFRVDQDASVIPNYRHDKACNLINTVGEDDAFRPIMACHGSTEESPRACNGYLARHGWENINVRVLLAQGKINSPQAVLEACADRGIELEPDYPTVLAKLERSLPLASPKDLCSLRCI